MTNQNTTGTAFKLRIGLSFVEIAIFLYLIVSVPIMSFLAFATIDNASNIFGSKNKTEQSIFHQDFMEPLGFFETEVNVAHADQTGEGEEKMRTEFILYQNAGHLVCSRIEHGETRSIRVARRCEAGADMVAFFGQGDVALELYNKSLWGSSSELARVY